MSPRSSLLRRAAVPLLAVAAAAALCAPTRAATASWDVCQVSGPKQIAQRFHCNFTGNVTWQEADFHTKLLGTGGSYEQDDQNLGFQCGGGDYYYPGRYSQVYTCTVASSGTYNCWCICSGGNSGGAWYASTGGTTQVAL